MIKLITYGCDICEKDINPHNKWEYHHFKQECDSHNIVIICKECFKKWYREHKDDDVHILEDVDKPNYNHKAYYHSIQDVNDRLEWDTHRVLKGTRKVSSFLNKKEFKALGAFMLSCCHPNCWESYHASEGFCNEYI
jgi:hypothetical protein